MVFNKKSLMAILFLPLVLFLGFGVANLAGVDFNPYVLPLLQIMGWFILYVEVGIKRLSDLADLNKLTALQWITLSVATLSLVNGVLTLPGVGIEVAFLKSVSAYVSVVVGLMYGIELVTNR